MPRKPRIELLGKYHIVNRGVEQRVVFKEPEDYKHFEELLCVYAKSFNITIHNYCLMSNHYHLLLEIKQENLSKFMRQLNILVPTLHVGMHTPTQTTKNAQPPTNHQHFHNL